MSHKLTRRIFLSIMLFFWSMSINAQALEDVLVGYWHNWNDDNAPYIPLDEVDNRYNVISLSFAVPVSGEDMTMQFVPDGTSPTELQTQIENLKNQGKMVLLSVGGATANIDLDSEEQKAQFVSSINTILETYGFNGLDIDIEHGSTILNDGGTIDAPESIAQNNLIYAVQEIMEHYYLDNGEKLYLTITPETAYVQGGQSDFGGIWGGYLPIIHALRDSLDILQVQLYNSGTMFGIDGVIYEQGNADFIVAMTEAVIQGFNTSGGFFEGLPANKVTVGLPACALAAGGGYVPPLEMEAAVQYLLGNGSQPGNYTLAEPLGYPDLKGLMTWSINWDAVESCGVPYQFADTYETIFGLTTNLVTQQNGHLKLYPNPATDRVSVEFSETADQALVQVLDVSGRVVAETEFRERQPLNISHLKSGVYFLTLEGHTQKLIKH